jgi:hypothetical protein
MVFVAVVTGFTIVSYVLSEGASFQISQLLHLTDHSAITDLNLTKSKMPKSKKIKEEGKSFPLLFYGRFCISSTTITRVMMPRTNSAAIAGMKYRSAADGAWVGIGVAVAAGVSTKSPVSELEP